VDTSSYQRLLARTQSLEDSLRTVAAERDDLFKALNALVAKDAQGSVSGTPNAGPGPRSDFADALAQWAAAAGITSVEQLRAHLEAPDASLGKAIGDALASPQGRRDVTRAMLDTKGSTVGKNASDPERAARIARIDSNADPMAKRQALIAEKAKTSPKHNILGGSER
jgi:hypothetical protein